MAAMMILFHFGEIDSKSIEACESNLQISNYC